MKKIYVSLVLIFALAASCFPEILISKINGQVEIFRSGSAAPAAPKIGQMLVKDDKIKTLENGRIQLIFQDGTAIWLKENSEINISSLIDTEREISIIRGKTRVRVTPLKLGARFSFKTPTAVCAVRGTEFIIMATENDSNLLVLSGKVEMTSLIPSAGAPPGAPPRVELVSEGQKSVSANTGEISAPAEFSTEDIAVIHDATWQQFEQIIPEKTEGTDQKKEIKKETESLANLKKELQDFVSDSKTDVNVINNIVREVRQSDFSTARSMRDYNGNLVRVEQDLLRPDPYTVEFLNLTQRDSYVYNGKFDYAGPATKRTDYIDAKMTFNKALPDQITDWPNYFQSLPKDSFKLNELNVEIANKTGVKNHYFKIYGKRDTALDTIDSNFYVSPDGTNEFKVFAPTDADKKSGTLDTITKDGDSVFWATAETPFFLGDSNGNKTNNIVWLKNESFGINNNGTLLDINYVLGSQGKDPFTVLKEIAFETIISAKKDSRTGTNYFGKAGLAPSNLDIIWTPDLIMAIAQKLAPQLSNISSDTKTNTNSQNQ